jgi:hypothetical protein
MQNNTLGDLNDGPLCGVKKHWVPKPKAEVPSMGIYNLEEMAKKGLGTLRLEIHGHL